MDDLNDLLHRASDGDPNHPSDPMDLRRLGRHRVYRRRGVTAVSGVVAASLAIVGGATLLPGTTDGGTPSGDGRPPAVAGQTSADSGYDDRDQVSRAEVERRCTTVWRNQFGPDTQAFELRERDQGPWFEGDRVTGKHLDKKVRHGGFTYVLLAKTCAVPEAGLADTAGTVESPLPEADDKAGIRVACGRYHGWDFTGWQVLTADRGDGRLAAVLRSTDGYVASCRLDSQDLFDDPQNVIGSTVRVAPESTHPNLGLDAYEINPGCQRKPPGQWEADCLATGWVSGPKAAARIVITDVTGTRHEIPVVDRWFAFAGSVTNHADVPESGCPPAPNVCDDSPGELHFTVYAADGSVLAEYDEADMPLGT